MGKMHITDIQVFRRTFEGKTNPCKNDDAVTSKYYPSKKYLLRYKCTEYGDRYVSEAYKTKRIAEERKDLLLKYNHNRIGLKEDSVMLKMYLIGIDYWDRPVYRDESGKIWKDVNCGSGKPYLHNSADNDFEGEPDMPITVPFEIVKSGFPNTPT